MHLWFIPVQRLPNWRAWTDRSMSCCVADVEDAQYALNCNIESLLVLMSLNMLSSLLVNCAHTESTQKAEEASVRRTQPACR